MPKPPQKKKPAQVVEKALVSKAFPSNPVLHALPQAEAVHLAENAFRVARGVKEVDAAMRERRLAPIHSRAKGFTPFSRITGRVHHVSVIPYNSSDTDSDLVGGMGISDTEPASGVIVRLQGHSVAQIWLLDFVQDKLVERKIDPVQLMKSGPQKFDETWERTPTIPNLPASISSGIAIEAFQHLLGDEFAAMVYSMEDVRALAFNVPVISAIAELQYMRHLGTPTANACTCTCTCSWGCCSSCSATGAQSVNPAYYQWDE